MSDDIIQSEIDKPDRDQGEDIMCDDWTIGKVTTKKPYKLFKYKSWKLKKGRSKSQSNLSLQQLRRKCRTTVNNLEKKCNNLKSQLQTTEANIVDEKIKLYRLQKIAEFANDMIVRRENKVTEAIEELKNEMNRLDKETQNAAENAQWLAHENHLLKWFLELLNNVSIMWACSRLCRRQSSIGV